MSEKKSKAEKVEQITITPPNFQVLPVRLVGTSPYVQNRMSQKAMNAMRATMAAGSTTKKGKKKDPRDFDADCKGALHLSTEGWVGVPASALRNACIDVCRMAGHKMTHARMSLFVLADGEDAVDGTPLVRLDADAYEQTVMPVRNQSGVIDLRSRPMWRKWALSVRIRFDADQFSAADVLNLLHRAGVQCGLGEGRNFSKESNGLGFGSFEIGQVGEQAEPSAQAG